MKRESVLVLASHANQQLHPGIHALLAAAAPLAGEVDVLLFGSDCQKPLAQARRLEGVRQLLCCEHPLLATTLAENVAPWLAAIMRNYTALLMPADGLARDLLPRLGALMGIQPMEELVEIIDTRRVRWFDRCDGSLQTLVSQQPVRLLSLLLRRSAPPSAAVGSKAHSQASVQFPAPVQFLAPPAAPRSQVVARVGGGAAPSSGRPDLASARVVVAGGGGLRSAEACANFYALADKLHAAVGVSRAGVDAGLAGVDALVGQSGRVVAPELYLAIGLSGALQHQAGMREAKLVVAINPDAAAPIFELADYGLVANAEEVIPELLALL